MNTSNISLIFFLLYITLNGTSFAEERLSGSHFEVMYEGFNTSYAETTLKIAEASYIRTSESLGHDLKTSIPIILTSTDHEFRELTRDALPEWSAAVTMHDNRIIITPLAGRKHDLASILAHEIVHIFINDAAGGNFVPRWFHEGCAQNLSGEFGIRSRFYIFWKTIRGELLSFEDIQDMFTSRTPDAYLAYDQSMLAILHLIRKNGRQAIPTIIDGLENGHDFPTSFLNATGVWPSEFEIDYLAAVNKTYGKRSLYTMIPGTWTFIMILAVVAYVIKRRRTKRLMQQWEIVEAAEKIIQFPYDE